MTLTRTKHFIAIAILASAPAGLFAAADDASSLARAKDLYLSAAYDEALALLDTLTGDTGAEGRTEIAEYRVFCLLALDRLEEAQKAIGAIVDADPFYLPSDAQASPRIRTVFKEARRALLPKIVQRAYADAKGAFERRDPTSAALFDHVLAMLDDPDLAAVPSFVDLRTVVSGFRDLSRAIAMASLPATPPPSAPDAQPSTPVAQTDEQTAPPPTSAPQPDDALPPQTPVATPIASWSDATVTPPIAVFQPLPPWIPRPAEAGQAFTGTLEIMIDENGGVTSANLASSVHPQYDAELLKAARTWRFKPAMKDGVPTKYLRVMEIRLRPRS